MNYLILGLLILSPMTGYELQQFIRQNLFLICSHSAGSMQTALAKLEQSGWICAEETVQGKRRKKRFFITEEGRAAFSAWVSQPMQSAKVKNMELSRLFFLGLASPAERIAAIRDYIGQMEQAAGILRTIRQRFDQVHQSSPDTELDWDSVFRFQGYTIDYGIAAAEFEKSWYSRLLNELEETV